LNIWNKALPVYKQQALACFSIFGFGQRLSRTRAVAPDVSYIQTYLNSVYAPAIANFTVSKKAFTTSLTSPFDNTVTDKMNYNDAQDVLIKAFKGSETIDKKALYLFFIKENTTHSDIKGHMPFNRQFGFIYAANQSITELTRTMAHELGHGAFRLKHTFSNENEFVQDQGQTPNLMDYASGSELLKYQWDECHDFDLGCNWFEDGDEATLFDYSKIETNKKKQIENAISNLRKRSMIYNNLFSLSEKNSESILFLGNAHDTPEGGSLFMYEENIFKRIFYDEKYYSIISIREDVFLDENVLENTLAEELFHYSQSYFYGREIVKIQGQYNSYEQVQIKANLLQYETEVKILRLYTGNYSTEYEPYWADYGKGNRAIVVNYFTALKNNKVIDSKLKQDFQNVVKNIAKSVQIKYKMDQSVYSEYESKDFSLTCLIYYFKKYER
jgi:hypothetical protein